MIHAEHIATLAYTILAEHILHPLAAAEKIGVMLTLMLTLVDVLDNLMLQVSTTSISQLLLNN